ncbi:MAG: hypothetical protein GXY48_04640 [Methanomicrobiales archaeon]|nr:hypothetical protein [Methanomicrobiales archaeon]
MSNFSLSRVILLIGFTLITGVSPAFAAVYSINGSEIDSPLLSDLIRSDPTLISGELPPGQVIFFWNTHCGACHMTWDFLDEFIPDHPEMKWSDYNLFNSTENRTIFEKYKEKYSRSHLSVPSMMIGNITLEGTQDIRNHLGEILNLQQNISPSPVLNTYIQDFFRNFKLM